MYLCLHLTFFFFFNDTATTEIYTLSLHDALPIYGPAFVVFDEASKCPKAAWTEVVRPALADKQGKAIFICKRSEEHTSELQSQSNLVCRLLLEKKKNIKHATCTRQVSTSHTHSRT